MLSREEEKREAFKQILDELNKELQQKEQRLKELTINRVKQSILDDIKRIYKTKDAGAEIPEEIRNEEISLENEVESIKWKITAVEEYGDRCINKKSQ